MGANATKSINNVNVEELSKFNVDIAKQTKIFINTVNKVSQNISSTTSLNQISSATISINNTNISGSLNIKDTNLSVNSIVDVNVFNYTDFTNDLSTMLTQQFEETLINQLNNKLTPETIKKLAQNYSTGIDSLPTLTVNTNISQDASYKNLISNFIDKSTTAFKTNNANEISNEISNKIQDSFKSDSSILINNVNIGGDVNIEVVNLTVVSKLTSNIVIKNSLISEFINNVENQFKNIATITTSNEDSSKVSTEEDIKSSTTSSLDGVIKGLQALFAMPVNLLAILVFGIVAIISVLGVVFVLTIKYLISSPESIQLINSAINKIPGKGTIEKEQTLSDNYLNQINNLLSNSYPLIETSIY